MRSSSHSHSSPVPATTFVVVWSANSDGIVFFQGEFQGQVAKWRYLPIGVCDRSCVILRTKKARRTLNKEILDLLNKESKIGELEIATCTQPFMRLVKELSISRDNFIGHQNLSIPSKNDNTMYVLWCTINYGSI